MAVSLTIEFCGTGYRDSPDDGWIQFEFFGGEGGIRTRGTGLPYTCFPSKRLRPLGHLSGRPRNIPRDLMSGNRVNASEGGMGRCLRHLVVAARRRLSAADAASVRTRGTGLPYTCYNISAVAR